MTDIPGSPSTTARISVGGTTTNVLETIGDHDWFAITLSAGQSVSIALDGTGSPAVYDPYLEMRDSAGNVLAYNDDFGPGYNSQLNFTATSAGTYYIDASAYFYDDPAYDSANVGSYRLTVSEYVAPPPPPTYSYDQIADQLISGYWNSVGGEWRHFNVAPGGTITVNLTALTADGQFFARHALDLWSDSLGINFSETGGSAQISFDDSDSGAYSSSSTVGNIISHSDVNVETAWIAGDTGNLNSYSLQTYIHEIGHALGLGHAGNYNGNADYETDAVYANDAWSTTVMSYFSQQDNSYFAGQGFTYDFAVTPMLGDLVAMAFLYGTPTTTRTGNTVYGFNSNAGREVFNAALLPGVAYTIIDSGGTDTLDYSGFANNQRINLNSETFSNVGAGIGNVSIARGSVIENAIGGVGNDTLIGNSAANVLTGGAGNDSLDGGAGTDTATYASAAGGVTVSLAIATAQATGGAGADTLVRIENLVGSAFNDRLTGDGAANLFDGGAGNDVMNGAAGSDTVTYAHAAGSVVIDLNYAGDQNSRSFGYDTLVSIENLIGSSYADLFTGNSAANGLEGGNGNDVMYGNAGDDFLIGGSGNDRLEGGAGNDTVSGGDGVDTAYYDHASGGVTLNLNLATAQNTIGAGTDIVTSIERLIGSNYADRFTGTAVANVIVGRNGNDVINGADGYDRLQGDSGNDTVNGDSGYDTIAGGSGDDRLNGDDGNDSLNGGDGNDTLNGGLGTDIASYSNASAGVTVNLGVTGVQNTVGAGTDTLIDMERIFGSVFNDRLTGSADYDIIQGGAGNDSISGGSGGDRLAGDAGNDLISGGDGVDRIYGGAGQDNFRFNTTPSRSTNWDYIVDFSAADDTFQLSQAVFGSVTSAGTLSATEFRLGTSAADSNDHVVYDQARGYIYYDADGSGSGSQVLFARVAAGTVLTNADFSIIASGQTSAAALESADTSFDAMPHLDSVASGYLFG